MGASEEDVAEGRGRSDKEPTLNLRLDGTETACAGPPAHRGVTGTPSCVPAGYSPKHPQVRSTAGKGIQVGGFHGRHRELMIWYYRGGAKTPPEDLSQEVLSGFMSRAGALRTGEGPGARRAKSVAGEEIRRGGSVVRGGGGK